MDFIQAILNFLHLSATAIWIGGMAYNTFVLRPFLGIIDLPQRLKLVRSTLHRFICIAWLCIAILYLTGVFIADPSSRPYRLALTAKHGVVIAMTIIVAIISLVLYPKFRTLLGETDKSVDIGKVLGKIVWLVKLNLALGFTVLFLTAILEEI